MEKRHILPEALICLAVFAALCMVSLAFPLALFLLPLPGAYFWARAGAGYGCIFVAASVLAAWLLLGGLWMAGAVIGILGAVVAGEAIRRQISPCEALILSCAALCAAICLIMLYIFLSTGKDVMTYLADRFIAAAEEDSAAASLIYVVYLSNTYLTTGNLPIAELLRSGEAIREIALAPETLSIFRSYMNLLIPPIVASSVVVCGVLNLVIPRAVAKKRGAGVCQMPPFSGFVLPRRYTPYFVASWFLALCPSVFGWDNLVFAGNILYAVVNTVFLIQGLSLIEYLLKLKISARSGRIAILAVIYVFLSSFLGYIGLFDLLLRLRERIRIYRR